MNKYIHEIAAKEGKDPMEIYTEIQTAINYAWENADPTTGRAQLALMGDRGVPTVDQLIVAIQDRIGRYKG